MAFRLNPNAAAFVPGQTGISATSNAHADPSLSAATGASSGPGWARQPCLDGVIATEAALLQALSSLSRERLLFVDCEGSDLSKGSWRNGVLQEASGPLHGRLCLMQIGTVKGEVYAIDILELGARAFDLGLRRLLENGNVIKVVHDFRQDADALWHQFTVHANSLFDCQLCDVLVRRLNGHRTTFVMGSAKLFSTHSIEVQTIPGYGLLTQDQKLVIHERFSQDRHLWERRPLPEDMVVYAKADVLPLPHLRSELLRQLAPLVGGEAVAENLVLTASAAYNQAFVELDNCRCRLCTNAQENARFNGCRLFTLLAKDAGYGGVEPWLLQRLWRPEDAQPLAEPGPSRFYINEFDESVPIEEQPNRR